MILNPPLPSNRTGAEAVTLGPHPCKLWNFPMPTFAAVDIGSNSVRLKIARLQSGRLKLIA